MIEWSKVEHLDVLKADWFGIEQGKEQQKTRPTLFWLNHPNKSLWVIYLTKSGSYGGEKNPRIGPIIVSDIVSHVLNKQLCNIPRAFVKTSFHKRLEPIIKNNLTLILANVVT